MKLEKMDFGRQLASVPMRNSRVTMNSVAPGRTPILEVELQYHGLMLLVSRLLRLRRRRRFQLDPANQGVYERIDGKKSFEQLIDEFAADHKLTFFESRALLMSCIRNLMRSGLVVIAVKR